MKGSRLSPRRLVFVCLLAVASTSLVAQSRPETPARWYDDAIAAAGSGLYTNHCATCHGKDGAGAVDWRQRDAAGKLPPPPLNGTGHTWHHPAGVLMRVILDGSPGGGNMPAWRDVLTPDEAAAVIAHFQAWWPDDIYRAWYEIDQRSRGR